MQWHSIPNFLKIDTSPHLYLMLLLALRLIINNSQILSSHPFLSSYANIFVISFVVLDFHTSLIVSFIYLSFVDLPSMLFPFWSLHRLGIPFTQEMIFVLKTWTHFRLIKREINIKVHNIEVPIHKRWSLLVPIQCTSVSICRY